MSPTTRFGMLAAATILAVGYAPSCSSDDSTSPTTSSGSTSATTSTGSGGGSSSTSTTSATGSSGSTGSSTTTTSGSGGTAGSGGSGGTATSAGGSGGSGGATSGGGGGAGGAGGSGGGGRGGSGGSGGSAGSGGGGPKDGGAGGTNGGDAGGMFTFTGDFAMMGNRLCFKSGATRLTGQKSPKLNWSGVPAGTTHLVVSLRDYGNNNVHWIACNIPVSATGLPAGLPGTNSQLPPGTQQTADWYGPGAGEVHEYHYKVWAMKSPMTACNGLAQGPRNTLWTNLRNDEMGAKNLVLDSREIIAYGDQDANCM